jgi:hypothetical protein
VRRGVDETSFYGCKSFYLAIVGGIPMEMDTSRSVTDPLKGNLPINKGNEE